MLLIPILLPLAAGLLLPLAVPEKAGRRGLLYTLTVAVFAIQAVLLTCNFTMQAGSLTIWKFSDALHLSFTADTLGSFVGMLAGWIWLLCTIFAVKYMSHEKNETRFCAFLLLSQAFFVGVLYADNLLTMYLCFELTTLCSMPLVIHSGTKESYSGALCYLFFSVAGALLGLFGILLLYSAGGTLDFVPGGSLADTSSSPMLLWGAFCCVLGFGAKAGMFPLHAWLPAAHPAAPAPASALLSGLITKSGVVAIIRILFFVTGPAMLRGTWVQTALLILALITVLMGSAMALSEKNFKKRLAYSSVSQISYVLCGLFFLNETALCGSLLQIIFHATVKAGLFLTAGALIFTTGKTQVADYAGCGKRAPWLMTGYTVLSLSLIGIPPTGGFFAKWDLAVGALETSGPLAYLAPIVLLVSALLTAGYLLPLCASAFFGKPGEEDASAGKAMSPILWIPVVILAAAALLPGIFFPALSDAVGALAAAILGA